MNHETALVRFLSISASEPSNRNFVVIGKTTSRNRIGSAMSSSKPLDGYIWASAFLHYREFQFAMITLMMYDHAITLGKEYNFFWRGPRTLSKVLYLLIRYLSLALSLILILLNCGRIDEASIFIVVFALSTVIMLLCQAVVAVRVWYLFSRNAFVRTIAVGTLFASIAASLTLVFMLVGTMEAFFTASAPTQMQDPGRLIWLFMPALISHSIFLALKVYRFAQSGKSLHVEAPSRRFLKEGMLMYAFATGSLVFSIVCTSFTAPSQLSVFVMSLAGFPTAAVVVAVCRAMLSIRSLAATFHVDPEWLLNNAEMSRLPLRGGPNKSELYVELNSADR